jgi:hypothetical protein
VTIPTPGLGDVGIEISGVWTGTLVFEGLVDPTNGTFRTITAFQFPIGNGATAQSTTVNGGWIVMAAGFNQIRVRASALASGTANIYYEGTFIASTVQSMSQLFGTTPTGGLQAVNTDGSGNLQVVVVASAPASALTGIAFGKILTGGGSANNTFPIERTTYTEQSANSQMSVSSSSANDTAAGTGMRTVQITYFPVALTSRTQETVTLNGVTPVNTVGTALCFIDSIVGITVGTGGTNAGTITLFSAVAGGGVAVGTIAIATPGTVNLDGIDQQTYWAHHYVVSGKTCTIVQFDGGTQGNQNAEMFLSAKNLAISNPIFRQVSSSITVGLSSPTSVRPVPNTIKIVGPAKITMNVIPAGNNTAFFGAFDFWEQ